MSASRAQDEPPRLRQPVMSCHASTYFFIKDADWPLQSPCGGGPSANSRNSARRSPGLRRSGVWLSCALQPNRDWARLAGIVMILLVAVPTTAWQRIRQNLDRILAALRRAAPEAELILLQPYDAFADVQPSSVGVWRQLNTVIGLLAAGHRARVADAFAAFNGTGRICQLTFFCTEGDTHPTDAGYALLAHLLFDASDYGRLRHKY